MNKDGKIETIIDQLINELKTIKEPNNIHWNERYLHHKFSYLVQQKTDYRIDIIGASSFHPEWATSIKGIREEGGIYAKINGKEEYEPRDFRKSSREKTQEDQTVGTSGFIDFAIGDFMKPEYAIEFKMAKNMDAKGFAFVMKMATTADELPYEPKGKDARRGKCFAKFVLCTNNETGFAPLTSTDTRFWVIKVSPFEGAEDTEIEEKMKAEIPAFLHYLKNRKLHYPKVGRLYFDDSLFRTPALTAVIESSETPLVKNVKDVLLTQFFTLNQTVVRLSVEVLFELTKRQTKEADKSEVRRYLNDAVKKGLLAKGENTTFVYFDGKETQQGKSRIYIFHAKNWLNEEDYDELMRQIEEREHENSIF